MELFGHKKPKNGQKGVPKGGQRIWPLGGQKGPFLDLLGPILIGICKF